MLNLAAIPCHKYLSYVSYGSATDRSKQTQSCFNIFKLIDRLAAMSSRLIRLLRPTIFGIPSLVECDCIFSFATPISLVLEFFYKKPDYKKDTLILSILAIIGSEQQ